MFSSATPKWYYTNEIKNEMFKNMIINCEKLSTQITQIHDLCERPLKRLRVLNESDSSS